MWILEAWAWIAFITFLYLTVGRISQRGSPRRPPRKKAPRPEPYVPPPTRAEMIEAEKRDYWEQMRLLDEMGLSELEAGKIRTEARRRYLNRVEELL